MQIDLRTVAIRPQRNTFDHVARRLGADKPASRYLEGTLDIQASRHLQYRPTWDPERELFDVRRTALVMKDWYAFKDPRQFHYAGYCAARSTMQAAADAGFDFVESRALLDQVPSATLQVALEVLLPLRHAAWGANLNNSGLCAYLYGTAITQPCIFHAMDQLAIAQVLTRIGLLAGDAPDIEAARQRWLGDAAWQPLRRQVEASFVLKDWFELLVAQNFVIDGILFPLAYDRFASDWLIRHGGAPVAMLTTFMTDWFAETSRWMDSVMKIAAAESAANRELLARWTADWRGRAIAALDPVARLGMGGEGESQLQAAVAAFDRRAAAAGLA